MLHRLVFIALAITMLGSTAPGQNLRYTFDGTITVTSGLGGGEAWDPVTVGQPFTVELRVDASTIATPVSPGRVQYTGSIVSLYVNINGIDETPALISRNLDLWSDRV